MDVSDLFVERQAVQIPGSSALENVHFDGVALGMAYTLGLGGVTYRFRHAESLHDWPQYRSIMRTPAFPVRSSSHENVAGCGPAE
jgi:hypothetical protein